jgi:hypothetical protein
MKKIPLRRAALTAVLSFAPLLGAYAAGDEFTQFAGFSLGATSLDDIQKRLGRAPLTQSVDGGGPLASICYTTETGRVVFMSAQADGKNRRLDGVALSTTKGRFPCAPWPKNVAEPVLGLQGLRLGIDKTTFRDALGSPSLWSDYKRKITARYDNWNPAPDTRLIQVSSDTAAAPRPSTPSGGYSSSVSVSGSFQRDRLTDLEVWKIETM